MEKTLKEILDEILDEVEQELDEATTTAGVDGYNTPFAFGSGRKKDKKKEKDVATQAGYTIAESINEAIKGRNNKTGESFGMVIGSDKKNREGDFEVTIRKGYSSRISSYGFVFDKDSNLISIKDYGYSTDGKFPDMKGYSSVSSVRPNKRETITQIAKITSPAFAKKIYQHVQKNNKIDESVNEATDRDFEKVYSIFDKKDYFNAKGLAKVQIGNFERALQRNDKGAQQILDKFKGDMDKAKEYITQVISDQKKEQAYGNYMELQQALADVMFEPSDSKVKAGVDFIKRRVHNNSQKYTMALYSALRKKKFTNYKDVHNDVDSLIGESVNEARLGKVSLLKSVENGETSRVEGVNISPELAFELRMFLQRPLMARSRTGIQIDNSQMKDAIPMLAKVGVHKRLSSGVKKEFTNLLKKYK
jgi:hypothetical protein